MAQSCSSSNDRIGKNDILRTCPVCKSDIKLYYINMDELVYMCRNTLCKFPVGHQDWQFVSAHSGDIDKSMLAGYDDSELKDIGELDEDDDGNDGNDEEDDDDDSSCSSTLSDIDKLNKICISLENDIHNLDVELKNLEEKRNSFVKTINNNEIQKDVPNSKYLTIGLNGCEQDDKDIIKENDGHIRKLMDMLSLSGVKSVKNEEEMKLSQ